MLHTDIIDLNEDYPANGVELIPMKPGVSDEELKVISWIWLP